MSDGRCFLPGISVLILGALLSTSAAAQPYVSGSVGLFMPEEKSASGFGLSGNAQVDDGLTAAGALGFRFLSDFRIEGEFAYQRTRLSALSSSGASFPITGANTDLYDLTTNFFYDIRTGTSFTPYLGGGVGVAYEHLGTGTITTNRFRSGDAVNLVWQLEAGLSYSINPRLSLVPAYRYQHYDDGGRAGGITLGDTQAHIVKLGLRYEF